jgi:hypothetical protein
LAGKQGYWSSHGKLRDLGLLPFLSREIGTPSMVIISK